MSALATAAFDPKLPWCTKVTTASAAFLLMDDVYAPQVSDFGAFDERRRLDELEFVASSTLQERSLKLI